MIQLKYPEKTAALEEMEEQFTGLSLAFRSWEDSSLEIPTLLDGKTVVNGMDNIKIYVDQLVLEVLASRNHAC